MPGLGCRPEERTSKERTERLILPVPPNFNMFPHSAGIPDFRTPGSGLYSKLHEYRLPYPEGMSLPPPENRLKTTTQQIRKSNIRNRLFPPKFTTFCHSRQGDLARRQVPADDHTLFLLAARSEEATSKTLHVSKLKLPTTTFAPVQK